MSKNKISESRCKVCSMCAMIYDVGLGECPCCMTVESVEMDRASVVFFVIGIRSDEISEQLANI